MKWFSHAYHEGRMSDAQAEAVESDYVSHCRELSGLLDPDAASLLELNIHDAQVQSYSHAHGHFAWRLLIGDKQRGYEVVSVTYSGADIVGGLEDVDELRLLDANTELLYDELELLEDGRLEHRILVWPEGEIWIRFKKLQIERAAAHHRARRG